MVLVCELACGVTFLSVSAMVVVGLLWMCRGLFALALLGNAKKVGATLRRRAIVVVGGDFARSPRMQYHAVSLLQCGRYQEVVLIGVDEGNQLCEALRLHMSQGVYGTTLVTDGLFRLHQTSGPSPIVHRVGAWLPSSRLRWVFITCWRVLRFVAAFGWRLFVALSLDVVRPSATRGDADISVSVTYPAMVLCQTPPAIPFIPLVKVMRMAAACSLRIANALCRWVLDPLGYGGATAILAQHVDTLRRTELMVDWHNFGFTLLQIDKRPAVVVKLYRWLEQHLCEGDVNLTVSKAMQTALTQNPGNGRIGPFRLRRAVHVLYDTAPAFFRPLDRSAEAVETLWRTHLKQPHAIAERCEVGISNVPLWFRTKASTEESKGLVIVSSTSWGSDDDYAMVVEALKQVDVLLQTKRATLHIQNVWVVVTGKGPTRARFEQQIANAKLSNAVVVSTVYFQSFSDYSTMLGAADLGLSVHFSSSGLDLPMKCVDMMGAGLPVAAVSYPCINELVTADRGWLFDSAESLLRILAHVMTKEGLAELQVKKCSVVEQRELWEASWNRVVQPLLVA